VQKRRREGASSLGSSSISLVRRNNHNAVAPRGELRETSKKETLHKSKLFDPPPKKRKSHRPGEGSAQERGGGVLAGDQDVMGAAKKVGFCYAPSNQLSVRKKPTKLGGGVVKSHASEENFPGPTGESEDTLRAAQKQGDD